MDRARCVRIWLQPADGDWPGATLAVSSGPHGLLMDSTVERAELLGENLGAIFLRLAVAFVDILQRGDDPFLASAWHAALAIEAAVN